LYPSTSVISTPGEDSGFRAQGHGLIPDGAGGFVAHRRRGFGWFGPALAAPVAGARFRSGPGLQLLRLVPGVLSTSAAIARTR
jgi:hypothetical protein